MKEGFGGSGRKEGNDGSGMKGGNGRSGIKEAIRCGTRQWNGLPKG